MSTKSEQPIHVCCANRKLIGYSTVRHVLDMALKRLNETDRVEQANELVTRIMDPRTFHFVDNLCKL